MSTIQIYVLVTFGLSILLVQVELNRASKLSASETPLRGWTRCWVAMLCLANPIIAGAVFYYGWRKKLPKMAKQSNTISITVFSLISITLILSHLITL